MRYVLASVCCLVLGCKESQVPAPQSPTPKSPPTLAQSLPDRPGETPKPPVIATPAPAPQNPSAQAKTLTGRAGQAAPGGVTDQQAATKPTGTAVAGLRFEAPPGWTAQPPKSRMRLAQYELPAAAGDPRAGVMTVIAAGGDVDSNIQRWKGQFEGDAGLKRTEESVGAMTVSRVEIEGTFLFKARPMAPGPGVPQPGTLLLGAIVQAPQGQLFFKAWGPKNTMERWRAGFDGMVRSFTRL